MKKLLLILTLALASLTANGQRALGPATATTFSAETITATTTLTAPSSFTLAIGKVTGLSANVVTLLSSADYAAFRASLGAGTGNGDVVGAVSSTDNAIAIFESTTGKLIQNSSAVVSDAGRVSSILDFLSLNGDGFQTWNSPSVTKAFRIGMLNAAGTLTDDIHIATWSNSFTDRITISNDTGAVAIAGNVTGLNLSGTNTGDQTTITGNAGTATALASARTINGVSFDGTGNITVTAAAGTLSGATLASGVTASSLTSAGGGTFGTNAFNSTAYSPLAGSSSIVTTGTLASGATGAGFTLALGASTITGTLPTANTAALTGDVTKTAGSNATTLASIPAISGANLTTLNASNLSSGSVADARLSANVPLLNAANSWTAAQSFQVAGAASVPAVKVAGVPFAGTGTTSFPLVYINDANATASSTLNTAGTYLGVNGDGTQDLMNLLKDGTSQFKISSVGQFTIAPTAGNTFLISTGFRLRDSASVGLDVLNAAGSDWGIFRCGFATLGQGAGGTVTLTGAATCSSTLTVTGNLLLSKTVTAAATTGAQTINKTTGSVNFVAGGTSLVVTNSLVATTSIIQLTVGANDTTMKSAAYVPGTGSFTIYPNAAPTAETRVDFTVTN